MVRGSGNKAGSVDPDSKRKLWFQFLMFQSRGRNAENFLVLEELGPQRFPSSEPSDLLQGSDKLVENGEFSAPECSKTEHEQMWSFSWLYGFIQVSLTARPLAPRIETKY